MQRSGKSLDTIEQLVHTVMLIDVLCMHSAKHLIDAGILGMKVLGKSQHITSFTNWGHRCFNKICDAGPALGCTLVASLVGQNNFTNKTLDHNKGTHLTEVINQFRQQVDQFLPGMYAWFDDSSLHVTIRALMG